MKILRALRTNILTQAFYSNLNMVDFYKKLGMNNHGGFDWGAKTGEEVYFDCSCGGYVLNTEIDLNGGLGISIITQSAEGILKHRYWHLKGFNVIAGQKVETGDLIGWADNTGLSTGTHLHRDMKEMEQDKNGSLKIKNYDNGTFGTIDYSNMFINVFVLDYIGNLEEQIGILQKLVKLISDFIKGRN